jgi:hypothetical protein
MQLIETMKAQPVISNRCRRATPTPNVSQSFEQLVLSAFSRSPHFEPPRRRLGPRSDRQQHPTWMPSWSLAIVTQSVPSFVQSAGQLLASDPGVR